MHMPMDMDMDMNMNTNERFGTQELQGLGRGSDSVCEASRSV